MTLRSDISKNIRARRKQLGLTQEQLAKRAKRTTRYINSLEGRSGKNLTIETVERIATALDCDALDLMLPTNNRRKRAANKFAAFHDEQESSEAEAIEFVIGLLKESKKKFTKR